MNVIKSMGVRFNKLWRWIKETAWVQPLLIVGAIFAIIFSIPKFSAWFEAMGVGSTNSYYSSHKLSLEGEIKLEGDYAETDMTQADKITKAVADYSFDAEQGTVKYSESEYYKKLSATNIFKDYGEKFFLVYVESTCASCDEAQNGFEALANGWNTTYAINDAKPFKLHSIFADDTSYNDSKYITSDDSKAFYRYLSNFTEFWEVASGRLEDNPYKSNASQSDSYFDNLEKVNAPEWQVPTIFLVDFTEAAWAAGKAGISEVIFGVTGSSSVKKAQLLQQMWNHVPQATWNEDHYETVASTEDKTNPFRAEYSKA